MPPGEAKPKAREAAQRALQLNPRLAEAHAVLGNVAMSYEWDLPTADKELRRAIELNPNDPTPHEWYCHLLIVEGHNSEALAQIHYALDLDPVNPLFHAVLAETYYYARSYDAAIEEAHQLAKLHPATFSPQFSLAPPPRGLNRRPLGRSVAPRPSLPPVHGQGRLSVGKGPQARFFAPAAAKHTRLKTCGPNIPRFPGASQRESRLRLAHPPRQPEGSHLREQHTHEPSLFPMQLTL